MLCVNVLLYTALPSIASSSKYWVTALLSRGRVVADMPRPVWLRFTGGFWLADTD